MYPCAEGVEQEGAGKGPGEEGRVVCVGGRSNNRKGVGLGYPGVKGPEVKESGACQRKHLLPVLAPRPFSSY